MARIVRIANRCYRGIEWQKVELDVKVNYNNNL